MNYQTTIQKLETRIAKIRAKMAKQEGKQYLALAKKYGHQTIDELIKALAAYASPVMKGKIGITQAKTPAKVKSAAPKAKRKRAKIDDAKRKAIIADLKAGEMTAAKIADKNGVSVPSVNAIKKQAGLTKR